MENVKITMPNGPAVQGTRIVVDGVEQHHISRIVVDLKANDVGKLELYTFVDVEFDGTVEVERVHVCPECLERLTKELKPGFTAVLETTTINSQWRRMHPIAVRTDEGEVK